jgi:hypothetical protein
VDVEPDPAWPSPDAPLAAGDCVPLFRTDLCVARGASPGLYDVSVPGSERRFTVYEFELAIGRLLDGRRTAAEVVEHGVRLGIPVDLAGLHKFVRQMGHYGFLAPTGTPLAAGGGGTWAERDAWDEGARTLFQTGVRLMRAGRPADAASYFEAVLDMHPGSAEANEMLAIVGKGTALVAPPPGGALPASPPAPSRSRRVLAVAVAAGAGALLALATVAGLLLRSRAGGLPAAAPEAPPAPPPPAALAVSVALAPRQPSWRAAPVEARRHPSIAALVSPGNGTLRWRAAAGATVRPGDLVAEVRVEPPAGGARPDLARRIAELEALAAQDPVYRDFLEKARREARAARPRARVLRLVAPAAGVLEPREELSRVEEGAALGEVVEAASWRLDAVIEGEPPGADAACEVTGSGEGERVACRVVAASGVEGGRTALTVEAAAAPFLAHAEALRVRVAPPALAAP